jgi:tetratricopeptide (TPR) repeat protein
LRRDLLITALIFTAVGFVGGVVYSQYSPREAPGLAVPAAVTAQNDPSLPEGHPPMDLARRWQELREKAEANPRDAKAALELANFLFDHERWQDAVPWYQRVVELEPRHTDARTDLATCLHQVGRFDEAVKEYQRSLELEPDKPQALYGLALTRLHGFRDRDGARRDFERLRRTHPDFAGLAQLEHEFGSAIGAGAPR